MISTAARPSFSGLIALLVGVRILWGSTPAQATAPPPVVIFGQGISQAVDPTLLTPDADFLQYLGLNRLPTLWTPLASAGEMIQIEDALYSATPAGPPPGTPVFIGIYTTHQTALASASIDSTQAYSIAMENAGEGTNYYYQRNGATFYELGALRTILDGEMTFDVARALHFAAFDQIALPASSKMLVFQASSFPIPADSITRDRSLLKAFVTSPRCISGLATLGLHGDSIFVAAGVPPGGGTDHCGNIPACEEGIEDCPMDGQCRGSDGDICPLSAAVNQAVAQSFDLGVHVDFQLLRSFRDDWMRLYYQGREYVAMYYAFGPFAKMDTTSLRQYAAFLPPAYTCVQSLLMPSGDPVIVTPLLQTRAMAIIDNHRDIPDTVIQGFLDRVESDLQQFAGLPRSQVLQSLKLMDPPFQTTPGWSWPVSLVAAPLLLFASLVTWRRKSRREATFGRR